MSIRKALLALAFGLCINGGALADTLALKADHPKSYVVVKGDTLWDISSKFLRDPWRWPEIWHNNPEINNPHLIYPGDIVNLVYIDGKPTLQVQRGRRTVKLSPKAHATHLTSAVAAIPASAISQFLQQPRIVTKEQLDQAGYITSAEEGHIISGVGGKIYVMNLAQDNARNFSIYRINKAYRNPHDDDDILGYEAIHASDADLINEGSPATLLITQSHRETLPGYKVLVSDEDEVDQNFEPHAPENNVSGQIISFLDGMSRAGQYQTVVIDLGKEQGLEEGNVLAVSKLGAVVRDAQSSGFFKKKITLPDERAGLLMVVRTFDRLSYAIVMSAEKDMRVGDPIGNP
ncbi:LysM peptidoglycan-binding domain-containing protein [Pseudomonadota bacterium]